MTWLTALPAIAVGLVLILLPGAALGWSLRLKGLSLWATAPALSTSLIATSAVILGLIGIRWNPASALAAVTLLVLTAHFLLRSRATRMAPDPDRSPSDSHTVVIAWLLAALPLAVVFMLGVGTPEAFTQRYDNIFHLNLLRHIVETGEASPLTAGRLQSPDADFSFYPSAWHAFATLIGQLSGVSIPVSAHIFNLTVLTVTWPLGALLLTRQLMPESRLALYSAGAVAGAMSAFPLAFMHYGVLYAYGFGLALVPTVLALTLRLLGIGSDANWRQRQLAGIVLVCALPGAAVAHPSAFMGALALSIPLVWLGCLRGWQQLEQPAQWRRVWILASFTLAAYLLCTYLRPGFSWNSNQPLGDSVYSAVTLGFLMGSPIILSLLTLVGAFRGASSRTQAGWAIFTMWATAALLYVLGAALSMEPWREIFVGIWYGDLPRLAAILCVTVVPAASYGFTWLFSFLKTKKYAQGGLVALPVSILLLALHSAAGWNHLIPTLRAAHSFAPDAPIVSTDEHRLLMRLPDLVPSDAVIAGSPWTGTAQAYSLAGRRVVLPHPGGTQSPEQLLVLAHLRDADTRPDVCEAAVHENIQFVLDFGTHEPYDGNHRYPGIEQLDESNAVELIAQEGDARLFRVTACDFGS
ncbi:DUF6541 family protein [Leucobacter sp. W1478]|uniref:DUF6541 family protein n=1 Tax=Leucobacter sp. W1478 TaxID=3439065 RepID=UPI003F376497